MAGREVLASHTNTERERITIERITDEDHGFAGQLVLVIHDDPPMQYEAPMLLDLGTRDWLSRTLNDIAIGEQNQDAEDAYRDHLRASGAFE